MTRRATAGSDGRRAVASLVLGLVLATFAAAQTRTPAPDATPAAAAAPVPSAISVSKAAQEGELPWPHTFKSGDTTLTLYQPQLDSWNGYELKARLAIQAQVGEPRPQGESQPPTFFGIVTVQARTMTDKGDRVVTVDQAKVLESDFPSAPDRSAQWGKAIADNLDGKSRVMSLDRLEAALAVVQAKKPAGHSALQNPVPIILFSHKPAILIRIDGQPTYRAMPDTVYERLINTRALILKDKGGTHYLKIFDGWMSAPAVTGPWTVLAETSAMLEEAFRRASMTHEIDALTGQSTQDEPAPKLKDVAPDIVTATSAAELIVTEGAPRYVPIEGTKLLYVENTTGNVFKNATDNRTYVLVSGRWFSAESEAGPWHFVEANALPEDFSRIPDDSPKENVKASIAGTDQAREAAIAASIPQTAAVKVKETKPPAIPMDGAPVMKQIEGTALQYVANASVPIIHVPNDAYYSVQNAVWFRSLSANGPWVVAIYVPPVIYTIPPSSPLYYVTFVQVYGHSGDTVYEGYTQGYTGTVVDETTDVVVYGTGYYYDPWMGSVWYGAPITYGYGAAVAYTPWTGWAVAFGMGWAWGASTVAMGWGWGCYPYWGAYGTAAWGGVAYGARGGAVAWGPGGWAGYSGNVYSQWGNRATTSRYGAGYNAWTGNAWAGRVSSSYNSRTGVASAGQRGAVRNVYTGNYAAGARGAATGPGGNAAAGARVTAGNAYTGNRVTAGAGAFYNQNTGQVTTGGFARSNNGTTVGRVGDDVYAGRDGNVYRNTGNGWESHTPGAGSNWQSNASGSQLQNLDSERAARQSGDARASQFQSSSRSMSRSVSRGGMGRMGGGRRR